MTTKRKAGIPLNQQTKKVKFEGGNKAKVNIKSENKRNVANKWHSQNGLKRGTKSDRNAKQLVNSATKEDVKNWKDYKEEAKQLRLKRKQSKSGFDVIVKAKKIMEVIKRKQLEDGKNVRNKLTTELHNLLKEQNLYSKFALAHDTARVVQCLLKHAAQGIKCEIADELLPFTISMMQSKYGIFCIKCLLKYGNLDVRQAVVKSFYGNAVKLASHAISATVFDYAYSRWATSLQRIHLTQEFYGNIYKNSKDDKIKSLKDVFVNSPDLKAAALSATKENLSRILNKNLLNSMLVHSVLYQFLLECSVEEKTELVSQLTNHIVILSNTKDGSKCAMLTIWHGTSKQKKVIMKSLKDHLLDLCKHEYGYSTVIALIDSVDDTVLLNRIILSEILTNAKTLIHNEWGRKVLLWMVAPGNSSYFHPQFIKELDLGREISTIKKSAEIRRKEILTYAGPSLINLIISEPEFWLNQTKNSYDIVAIITSVDESEQLTEAFKSISKIIANDNWKIKEKDRELYGIENSTIHSTLKKLAQHDKVNMQNSLPTFGSILLQFLTSDSLKLWLSLNRGCFLLVDVFLNNSISVQKLLKNKIREHSSFLKKQTTRGSQILREKLEI